MCKPFTFGSSERKGKHSTGQWCASNERKKNTLSEWPPIYRGKHLFTSWDLVESLQKL